MRIAALVSGGKDSALSIHRALKLGHEVKCLVSMHPQGEESWMFHYPNVHIVDLFAESVGIPLVKAKTTGAKNTEVEDLKKLVATLDVEGLVSGAISSQYQKSRVERICAELGLKSITPLWQDDPLRLLNEIINLKFEAIIVGVYALGFDSSWLGRRIDQKVVKEFVELNRKYGVSLVGDGGEYETLVLDMPLFKKRIKLVETEKVWKGQSGYLLVKRAELVDKKT